MVPDPNRQPLASNVETWWVEQQLGISNLTTFIENHADPVPAEPLLFADLFQQLRPAFNEPQIDYATTPPLENDLVVPDDLPTVSDAIKYAVLEQGGNLSTMRTWDPIKCCRSPVPAPPQISPMSTLQPDALVLRAINSANPPDTAQASAQESQRKEGHKCGGHVCELSASSTMDLVGTARKFRDRDGEMHENAAHGGGGLSELSGVNVEDQGFWRRLEDAIRDLDVARLSNDTALVTESFCPTQRLDVVARWHMLQQQLQQSPVDAGARAYGGGADCRVIVEVPRGVFFYPASRVYCKAGDYFWDSVLIVPSLCWVEMVGQGSDASNLWGMIMLRPFSKGSFGGIFFCFLTRLTYEPTLVVQGGPWRFDQCDIRSSTQRASVALVTLDKSDSALSECAIGGLEPVVFKKKTREDADGEVCEEMEVFGEPNSGVICYDSSWCVMLGCTLEHTGAICMMWCLSFQWIGIFCD